MFGEGKTESSWSEICARVLTKLPHVKCAPCMLLCSVQFVGGRVGADVVARGANIDFVVLRVFCVFRKREE